MLVVEKIRIRPSGDTEGKLTLEMRGTEADLNAVVAAIKRLKEERNGVPQATD